MWNRRFFSFVVDFFIFHNLDVPTPPDGIDDDDDDAAAVEEEEEDMTVIDATDDGPSFFSWWCPMDGGCM
jgi:hypothetical protein